MAALRVPQNRKMVSLQRAEFALNGRFLKFFAVLSAPRPILRIRAILRIKFVQIRQLSSKFRHFRKVYHYKKQTFTKLSENLNLKTHIKSFMKFYAYTLSSFKNHKNLKFEISNRKYQNHWPLYSLSPFFKTCKISITLGNIAIFC